MNLKVLGSSSKGNSYILETPTGKLILDAGVPFRDILIGIKHKIEDVRGCLVTHSHGDHIKAASQLMDSAIDVYMTKGTADAKETKHHRLRIIEAEKQFSTGDFVVLPFHTEHDCNGSVGYLIQYRPTGEKLLFATDTYYVRYRFLGVNYFLIECNYIHDILIENVIEGTVPEFLMKRLQRSHFSLANLKVFFRANDLKTVRKIVLIHLSDGNSDPLRMRAEIEDLTRKEVEIARTGMEIKLDLCPF